MPICQEGGLGYAPLRSEMLADKEALVARLESLRKAVVEGSIKVPATLEALASFQPPAPAE